MTAISTCAPRAATLLVVLGLSSMAWAADPLPSWNDGATKQSVVKFVEGSASRGIIHAWRRYLQARRSRSY